MNNDLISREALKHTIIEICGKCSNVITKYENGVPDGNCAIQHILNMIDNAPTVELFCSYLSDGEVRQPCVEGPCEDERPQGEWFNHIEKGLLKAKHGDYVLYQVDYLLDNLAREIYLLENARRMKGGAE